MVDPRRSRCRVPSRVQGKGDVAGGERSSSGQPCIPDAPDAFPFKQIKNNSQQNRVLKEPPNYDILITLPSHQKEALQEELKKQFGLTAHAETRETDVLLLQIADPAKLQLHKTKGGGYRNYLEGSGSIQKVFKDAGLGVVANGIEVGKPVF